MRSLHLGLGMIVLIPTIAFASDYEHAPIQYSVAKPNNGITALQQQLQNGTRTLDYDEEFGYLPAVLDALHVPRSSQVLVFSKTSLQRQRITPKTPRAIYFNDDVTIGYCQRGDVLEISINDAQLGTVFYTLDQDSTAKPRFVRQTDNCLICHGGAFTRSIPGHLIRSVHTDREGQPVLALGSTRVDHETPFSERWGGWYVTGTHGTQVHRGNQITDSRARDVPPVRSEAQNCTSLREFFTVGSYLTPHSDLVALMVLEHQCEGLNRITRASMETRIALHQQAEFDTILNRKTVGLSESSTSRIRSVCEPLVRYLLFCDEAKLSAPIKGTSGFAEEFSARGPSDAAGRSLRQFDLQKRLFRYPCSYLIQSSAFTALPDEAKQYIFSRLKEILRGKDTSTMFDHISKEDRTIIDAILRATVKGYE